MHKNLARVIASIVAALVIAHALSFTIQSGGLQRLVTYFNPEDPSRQLERSLIGAINGQKANVVVVGHRKFVDAVQSSCEFTGTVIGIDIDRAGWREYDTAAAYLVNLEPSLFVFQGRSYMWTDLLSPWRLQFTNLLPRSSTELLPLRDVRTFIAVSKEIVQGRPSSASDSSGVPSLIGARFNLALADRFMARISRTLTRQTEGATAVFVVDHVDLPDDALPETRQQILEEIDREPRLPALALSSRKRFAEMYECNNDLLAVTGGEMRQRPGRIDNATEENVDES